MSFWLSLSAAAGLMLTQASARDWGETLRSDAAAIHEAISDNHPGMINPNDSIFDQVNERQYEIALERAEDADSFEDYFYALQHYVAAFNDGHLGFGVYGSTPDNDVKWPGFIVRDDGNRGLVVTYAEDWSEALVGARIVECDGRDAFRLGDDRMGARFGRWELASERAVFGPMVMLETGDPYVRPIERCVIEADAGRRSVELDWREGGADFYDRYNLFPAPEQRSVTMRQLEDGTSWISLPTFNGNPESEAGRNLRALVSEISEQTEALQQAPAIVFDLRGNGGGSSGWSIEIAEQLWGDGAFQRAPEPPMTVVWRASSGNLASLRGAFSERDANGNLSSDMREWYLSSIFGLEAAIEKGDDRWVIEPDQNDAASDTADLSYHPPRGKVFVLTDEGCMSACLDAVDLWTRLGAMPIGRETGADTVYMEVRKVQMPSGLGDMSLPMKFYIGRERGRNEPVKPVHHFQGDLNDTAALEAWVGSLRDYGLRYD
ncbi:hypothetical protein LTR94_026020, partial [Friedmanniomyces endolithicus]